MAQPWPTQQEEVPAGQFWGVFTADEKPKQAGGNTCLLGPSIVVPSCSVATPAAILATAQNKPKVKQTP